MRPIDKEVWRSRNNNFSISRLGCFFLAVLTIGTLYLMAFGGPRHSSVTDNLPQAKPKKSEAIYVGPTMRKRDTLNVPNVGSLTLLSYEDDEGIRVARFRDPNTLVVYSVGDSDHNGYLPKGDTIDLVDVDDQAVYGSDQMEPSTLRKFNDRYLEAMKRANGRQRVDFTQDL